MIYREEYEYFKNEMLEANAKGSYWSMANEPLADEYFSEGKKEFPELSMYKVGIVQFFCNNSEAKEKFKQTINNRITDMEQKLVNLRNVLSEVENPWNVAIEEVIATTELPEPDMGMEV